MVKNWARETVAGPTRPMQYKRMTSMALLQATRDIVARGWCQGSNALTAAGLPTSPMSDQACEWCLRGAAIRALQPSQSILSVDLHQETSDLSKFIATTFRFKSNALMVQWNDTQGRTVTDVLDYVDWCMGETDGDAEEVEEPDDRTEEEVAGDIENGAKPAAPSISRRSHPPVRGRKRTVQSGD